MISNYEDIINLPRHVSKKHSKMTNSQRAAQFAPFSALTGYSEAVKETARLTDRKVYINDDKIYILNEKLNIIKQNIDLRSVVTIIHFVKDGLKDGGKYVIEKGVIKTIDEYNKQIIMEDDKKILMENIVDIQGEIIEKEYYNVEHTNNMAQIW